MELTELIYLETANFPNDERYGLTSQIRRAAVSIPSNIAEGAYRGTDKDFARFLDIAAGSAGEVWTQAELAKRLGFLNEEAAQRILISRIP